MLQNASAMAVIPVGDLGRARTFYEKMLGLKPQDLLESEGEVVYSIGTSKLLVYQTQAARGEATKVVMLVEDLTQEMSDLKNHGVVFEDFDLPGLKTVNGVVEREGDKGAWFKDLDGNYIGLVQMK
jgi:catechol-2,3-dioxygenase